MISPFARIFIILGIIFLLVGGILYLLGRLNLPIGRLPGDIRIERENFSFHFPLVSSILISIILTVVLNLLIRIFGQK